MKPDRYVFVRVFAVPALALATAAAAADYPVRPIRLVVPEIGRAHV